MLTGSQQAQGCGFNSLIRTPPEPFLSMAVSTARHGTALSRLSHLIQTTLELANIYQHCNAVVMKTVSDAQLCQTVDLIVLLMPSAKLVHCKQ